MKSPREQVEDQIIDLCKRHGCKEKIRKIHFDQYVNKGWCPHPPEAFDSWWQNHRRHLNDEGALKPVIAYNCRSYRTEFNNWRLERKQSGLPATANVSF
jgi:hypothetical protein